VSISTPPWLLNTPPLAIVSAPGPNQPTTVTCPVTVEPEPVTIMLPATRMSVVCSEPPLVTASVPCSISTLPPTVNDPPLIVTPPLSQLHSERSPPIEPILPPLLAPVSVSDPLSSSIEPAPENAPENVVVLPAATVSRVVELDVPI
jgi:hypothetical protein